MKGNKTDMDIINKMTDEACDIIRKIGKYDTPEFMTIITGVISIYAELHHGNCTELVKGMVEAMEICDQIEESYVRPVN